MNTVLNELASVGVKAILVDWLILTAMVREPSMGK